MDVGNFVIPPGQGAVWQMAPGRSAALKITSEMTQSVMTFEEVAPTDTVTDLHVHHDSDEIAYVLSGEVTFKIGDQVTVGGPGTCAFMPRGLPHAWKSTGKEPGRVLFLYTPGNAGSFFEEAVQNNRPISTMSGQEVTEAFQRHRWEVIGPPPF
jgi:mannose-6-phosphate isomerase-like protein (cupin superfamily)